MQWIKLHNGLLEWEWHDMPEMVSLWVHLLMKANSEDKKWRGGTIKRGSFITSLTSLNDLTGISVRTLRTCLKRMENTGEIEVKVTNKYRIITICKYDSYQVQNQESDKQEVTQPTSNRQATDKQLTTTIEDKILRDKEYKENILLINNNISKKVSEVKKVVRFTPPTVDEVADYCESRDNGIDPEQFVSFYESKGWMVGQNRMKDWKACVRTWEKRHPKTLINTQYNEINEAPKSKAQVNYEASERAKAMIRRNQYDNN